MRAASAGVAAALPLPAPAQGAGARVVVVGGGFAGATCARTLKQLDPRLAVTMVEANPTRAFTACPFSNAVVVGLRDLGARSSDTTSWPAMGSR
jgi:2-polyprenyl-6-methoxyphenol hydroxylase-like FAD-dependent oxidoreductase